MTKAAALLHISYARYAAVTVNVILLIFFLAVAAVYTLAEAVTKMKYAKELKEEIKRYEQLQRPDYTAQKHIQPKRPEPEHYRHENKPRGKDEAIKNIGVYL